MEMAGSEVESLLSELGPKIGLLTDLLGPTKIGFLSQLGPKIGTIFMIVSLIKTTVPKQVWSWISRCFSKITAFFSASEVEITFEESTPGRTRRSKAYVAVETYIGTNFYNKADRLIAILEKGSKGKATLSMDDGEQISDVYNGVKVKWAKIKTYPNSSSNSMIVTKEELGKKSYVLSFHKRHRDMITKDYLEKVLKEGKTKSKEKKQQMLYTNVGQGDDWWKRPDKKDMWAQIAFTHPATFNHLAMDPLKKQEIMDELTTFSNAGNYYTGIGKAWKRGYLLYGPPGTGKSTMIAAMANHLHYDVYDLDLSAVEDNIELRKLLMEVTKRAIVVIEDIDCSSAITAVRKNNPHKKVVLKKEALEGDSDDDEVDNKKKEKKGSKVTLAGLLNVLDGLGSASCGERIIVFTTNHVDKLDPALTRTGRMDKHIEMSYCCFESFKVLANNYLRLDSHELFETIKSLLAEVDMSPADVAENMIPKSVHMTPQDYLNNLIEALIIRKHNVNRGEKTQSQEGEDEDDEEDDDAEEYDEEEETQTEKRVQEEE